MKEKLNEMPTKATTTTSTHESKQFPFVIIEQTETKNEKEKKKFYIGLAGAIISEKVFSKIESAEKYIESRPWELILGIVGRTFEIMQENEKSKS